MTSSISSPQRIWDVPDVVLHEFCEWFQTTHRLYNKSRQNAYRLTFILETTIAQLCIYRNHLQQFLAETKKTCAFLSHPKTHPRLKSGYLCLGDGTLRVNGKLGGFIIIVDFQSTSKGWLLRGRIKLSTGQTTIQRKSVWSTRWQFIRWMALFTISTF